MLVALFVPADWKMLMKAVGTFRSWLSVSTQMTDDWRGMGRRERFSV
jgi:hypothetical protein